MSAYVLYGVCVAAMAGVFFYANKCAYRLGRIHASNAERQRLAELVERIKKDQAGVKLQRFYYGATLAYYNYHADTNLLRSKPSFSKLIRFSVLRSSEFDFNDRAIKKMFASDFIASAHPQLLRNGELQLDDVHYLGQTDEVVGGDA